MHNYSFKIYECFNSEIKIKWDTLEKKYGWSPFQNFCWLETWYNEIGIFSKITPKIILLEKNNEVTAIFPLSIRSNFSVKILEWMGGIYADYKGPIINNQNMDIVHDFDTIWKEISKLIGKFDLIHFNRQPSLLKNILNPFILNFNSVFDIFSYKMFLDEPWEQLLNKKIKKKYQADSNRQIKRLNSIGEIEFIVANESCQAIKIVERMLEYKRLRYKEMNTFDYLKDEKNRNFFKKLSFIKDPNIFIHFSALTINGEIISTHVGIVWSNNFYYLMPANENSIYKSFSIGRLLLEKLIQESTSNGISEFDFTIGSEEYKKTWCDTESKLYQTIKIFSFYGFLYKCYLNIFRTLVNINYLSKIIKIIRKYAR